MNKLLSLNEASTALGLSPNTLYKYTAQEKIPHVKLGSRTLFDEKDLERWIEERKAGKKNNG